MSEIDAILTNGNISWTGEEIRSRLFKAGYAIVPREPTGEMIAAGNSSPVLGYGDDSSDVYYRAMIDAALK